MNNIDPRQKECLKLLVSDPGLSFNYHDAINAGTFSAYKMNNNFVELFDDILQALLQTEHFDEVLSLCKRPVSIKEWVQITKQVDEKRWFEHYSKTYPEFSSDEIAKMVNAGIIPKV